MIRPLIAALGVAVLTSGLAPGAASAGDRTHLSVFPGYLYLPPPPVIQPPPAPGIDFVTRTNMR